MRTESPYPVTIINWFGMFICDLIADIYSPQWPDVHESMVYRIEININTES